MDIQESFRSIGSDLSAGKIDEVRRKVQEISDSTDDPFVLLQCVSLLKVVKEDDMMRGLVTKIMANVDEEESRRVEIAGALKGLEYPFQAYEILESMEPSDSIRRLRVQCLMDMDEFESALEENNAIKEMQVIDGIHNAEILSALGEHADAIAAVKLLESGHPKNYDVMNCYVAVHMMAGEEKEAVRYARHRLKDKTADGNAILAYAMRIMGNDKAAAGYATRAIKMDPKHIGAMETLGICLARKGEYEKARIVAGAINEVSPGHSAAMEILRYCD
jgi:tetratricopeptide (TPR) repeat protein